MGLIDEDYKHLRHISTIVIDFGVKTKIVLVEKENGSKIIEIYKYKSIHANKPYYKRNYNIGKTPKKYKQSTDRIVELFIREYNC